MIRHRLFLRLALALALACVLQCAAAAAQPRKVLRYSFEIAETGFDPAQVSDIYSREIIDNVIESPLRFDQLARPITLRLATAAALPQMSADFRELTLKIRPGIFFADDPAFRGRPRELTAADYAYTIRRHYDPHLHSAGYAQLLADDIVGLQALREKAEAHGDAFDYDSPVEGLQVLDRYTLRLRFGHPSPRFALKLAQTQYTGAVAREVVEAYGPAIMEHPVGTGPFRLVQWRRASLIVLERNPRFREETWDEHPAPGDAEGEALAARLRGRRVPMIDRVEVSIIEEAQPSWLAYLGGDFDFTILRSEFVNVAAPKGRLAANLARQGMQVHMVTRPDIVYTYFNMEDPVVGGYTPDRVALRRAIGLGYDNEKEIRLLRKQLGVPAQGLVVPMVAGYDPGLRSNMSEYNPERARALLDMYGYVDRDGDGLRELPGGGPLTLHVATQNDSTVRALNELWMKSMSAIGIRVVFERAQWPTQLQKARAGKLQVWSLSQSAIEPDVNDMMAIAYGPNKGEDNLARFDLPAFNADFRLIHELPDGPARAAALADAQKLLLAYMPIKAHVHRVRPIVTQRWLVGYPSNPFVYGWWRHVDIDTSALPAR